MGSLFEVLQSFEMFEVFFLGFEMFCDAGMALKRLTCLS